MPEYTVCCLHDRIGVGRSMSEIKHSEAKNRLANAYTGQRILVTGGASFIFSHFFEVLGKTGGKGTVAHDLSSGKNEYLSAIAHPITFPQKELRDSEFCS